jgi:hypothetical protein
MSFGNVWKADKPEEKFNVESKRGTCVVCDDVDTYTDYDGLCEPCWENAQIQAAKDKELVSKLT